VREGVDPDLVIDLAMRVAEDEDLTPGERLAVLWPLVDRGFIKPPTTLAATMTTHSETTSWRYRSTSTKAGADPARASCTGRGRVVIAHVAMVPIGHSLFRVSSSTRVRAVARSMRW
jgi:hypothetical protein